MSEESILTDDFLRELMNVGEVDLMVGVSTYNDAATVGQVVQAIRAGLLKHFPRQRSVIINADGGSRDATQELVRAASINDMQHADVRALRTLHCISTRYAGGPASGRALQTLLAAADLLHPSACAVISSDSTTIEPEWIARLLRPVRQEGIDLVTPLYRRHKFDGLLVRTLVYPMTRALYCKRVREPYPSELAFSARLGSYFLAQDFWSQDSTHIAAELWLTITAMTEDFRLAQVFLGDKPRSDHAHADLVFAMRQTAGTLFRRLDQNLPTCDGQAESQPVTTIGGESEVTLEPLRVNRKRLYEMFVHGVAELGPILSSILSGSTLAELQRAASVSEREFCYSDELWVKTVYEFAASYHKAVISRDHIIQALAPLYRGKTYTFLVENRDASGSEVERNMEALCLAFERLKPYLAELWNGRK